MKRENVKPEPPVRENVTPVVTEQPKAEEPKVAPVAEEPKHEEPAPAPAYKPQPTIVEKIPASQPETDTFGAFDDLFKCIKKTKK